MLEEAILAGEELGAPRAGAAAVLREAGVVDAGGYG